MTYDTINDAVTMQGGTEGALLAGRYRVVRQLGQGGMGSVWLAEDTQLDNKQFAIKMLPSILVTNKRAYRQLKDEALVAMKLTHPNIVTLRAFEENNGNPFLVMDYIDGETLDDYLADRGNGEWGTGNGRAGAPRTPQDDPVGRDDPIVPRRREATPPYQGLSESDVLRLLCPIAAALDYAHSKGVVHRDVKPGNVMIAKDGTPYILDFGIAREIQETMTRVTGKLSSGTLLYMSPEQLNGDAPKKEQDIYSFAAMAYECLKGEPPFSRGNIEFQIMNKQPELLGPHIIISGLVMQGLAKKPEDRPKSCAAVLEGKGFSRVEHVERVEGNNFSSKGHKDRKEVWRGVPTAPHGMSASPRSPNRKIAGIALPIICIVAALLVIGGVLWHRGHQRKQAEWRRIIAAQKAEETARRQVENERRAKEEADRKKKAEEERLAAEKAKAEAERKVEENARLLEEAQKARERELAKQAEERTRREKEFKVSSEVAFKLCALARDGAVGVGADDFAKDELDYADGLLSNARCIDTSTEKGRNDHLGKLAEAKAAFEKACEAAKRNARPTICLTSTLNGVEKASRVVSGVVDVGRTTPITVDMGDFEIGTKSGFSVEYSEDGADYEGTCQCTVKKGRQNINVQLTPKFTLPPAIRHCRHCGVSLSAHSRHIRDCPSCGRSLLR